MRVINSSNIKTEASLSRLRWRDSKRLLNRACITDNRLVLWANKWSEFNQVLIGSCSLLYIRVGDIASLWVSITIFISLRRPEVNI